MSANLLKGSKKAGRKRKGQTEDENPKPSKRHSMMKTQSKTLSSFVTEATFHSITKLTPGQQVLSIPHLAETIFHASELSDVLNFRLVSSSLNLIAIRVIQQRTFLHFHNFWLYPRQIKKTMTTFNLLLKQPRSWPIPFTKFCVQSLQPKAAFARRRNLDCPVLQTFLQLHGNHITELSFRVLNDQEIHSLKESEVISHFKKILSMVPNLENLYISHKCVVEFTAERKDERSSLSLQDLECIELHSEKNVILNTKLKYLELGEFMSAKLCEMILLRSPNLHEVCLLIPWHANFLLEPIDRVHLLKKIRRVTHPCKFQLYEKINRKLQMGGNVSVSVVVLQLLMKDSHKYPLDESEMRSFVTIVNDLLELMANTLENLDWIGVAPLNSLKWPDVMPKLKWLRLKTLCTMKDLMGIYSVSYPIQEFKIFAKLPKLESVSFSDFLEDEFSQLANSFEQSAMPSVQHLAYDCLDSVSSVREDNQQVIQRLFPNAKTQLVERQKCT